VYVCRSLEELIHHYDTSGLLTMIVQEFIEWEQFIRCICIGQEKVMPIKYDPKERKYHVEHDHLSPELGKRVVDDSLKLVRALGYDMNSMEWAVRDGIPYAIDFMNPAPDMDIYSLTPHYFDWVVQAMADMAIDLAKNPRRQVKEMRWQELFAGSRESGAAQGGVVDNGSSVGDEPVVPRGQTSVDFGQSGTPLFAAGAQGGGAGGPTGDAAKELDAATSGGGPTAAQNQKIQELTFNAAAHGGGSGGHTGGAAGTEAIRADAGSVVDQSPITDLEPPAEAPTPPRAYAEPEESPEGKEGGNGRAAADESGREGGGRSAEGGTAGNGRVAAEEQS
jgi:hypothetical protein